MEIKGANYILNSWYWEIHKGQRPSRNKPCPCQSGKKYKKCCKANEQYTPKKIHKKDLNRINVIDTPAVAFFGE